MQTETSIAESEARTPQSAIGALSGNVDMSLLPWFVSDFGLQTWDVAVEAFIPQVFALQVGSEMSRTEQPASELQAQVTPQGQRHTGVLVQAHLVQMELFGADGRTPFAEGQSPYVSRPCGWAVIADDLARIRCQQHFQCLWSEAPIVAGVWVMMKIKRTSDKQSAVRPKDAVHLVEGAPKVRHMLQGA